MAIPGPAVTDKVVAQPAEHFELPVRSDAVIWGNSNADSADGGRSAPGLVKQLYVGSGDRGFTWIADASLDGWVIDPNTSMAVLFSDNTGQISWRMRLINRKTRLGGGKTLRFALFVHPATSRPDDTRRHQWFGLWQTEVRTLDRAQLGHRNGGPCGECGRIHFLGIRQ